MSGFQGLEVLGFEVYGLKVLQVSSLRLGSRLRVQGFGCRGFRFGYFGNSGSGDWGFRLQCLRNPKP